MIYIDETKGRDWFMSKEERTQFEKFYFKLSGKKPNPKWTDYELRDKAHELPNPKGLMVE